MFDFREIRGKAKGASRYHRQISRLTSQNFNTQNISQAVDKAIANIKDESCRSFIIYGEPQSGKTEMMIALTSRLLDEGFRIIIILLNDDVELLKQNIGRFGVSGIDPAPKNSRDILDHVVTIGENEWIIFSKKNSSDLNKLIQKIGHFERKVVIDDEADYATPNAKVNKGDKTKINEHVERLLGTDGIYIGVTATPARLDLNNTYNNESKFWVDFPPPPPYRGMDVFFPEKLDKNDLPFRLKLLSDINDSPRFLREAVFSFLINASYINMFDSIQNGERNWSILIHTSGKKDDHSIDYEEVQKIFNILKNEENPACERYFKAIYEEAEARYPGKGKDITTYIFQNHNRKTIIVLNSDPSKKPVSPEQATNPSTLFTVIIGGNKVSRGVTFHNLLTMFFTRNVKHKIQQDTYIQRARMFGYRDEYLHLFELHIPETLYLDWHKCFVFHRLSLSAIRSGREPPVWVENNRISAASSSSIDKTRVYIDTGEMSFGKFELNNSVDEILNSKVSSLQKIESLFKYLGSDCFPEYILCHVRNNCNDKNEYVAIHPSFCIARYKDANQESIERPRGFIGTTELEKAKYPEAVHHFKMFFNAKREAKLFYKYEGDIRFLRRNK